jgi:ABC-type multidrug transport system permease subunit
MLNGTGIRQTVLENVASDFLRTIAIYENIASVHGEQIANEISMRMQQGEFATGLTRVQTERASLDPLLVVALGFLMMSVLTGMDTGILIVQRQLPGLRKAVAVRLHLSPVTKLKTLSCAYIANVFGMFICAATVAILLEIFFGMPFSNNILLVAVAIFASNAAAVALGMLLTVAVTKFVSKDESAIGGVVRIVYFGLLGLAGLFSVQIRIAVRANLYWLDFFNPVTSMIDSIYAAMTLADGHIFWSNIMYIILFCVVCLGFCVTTLSKNTYESI